MIGLYALTEKTTQEGVLWARRIKIRVLTAIKITGYDDQTRQIQWMS